MALNKYATWGVPPTVKPHAAGLATVVRDGFAAVVISKPTVPAPPPPATAPSATAFKLIAVLGQVRDPLLDQHCAKAVDANSTLAKVRASQSFTDAVRALGSIDPILAKAYETQARDFKGKDFDTERLARLAELMKLEHQLAQDIQ